MFEFLVIFNSWVIWCIHQWQGTYFSLAKYTLRCSYFDLRQILAYTSCTCYLCSLNSISLLLLISCKTLSLSPLMFEFFVIFNSWMIWWCIHQWEGTYFSLVKYTLKYSYSHLHSILAYSSCTCYLCSSNRTVLASEQYSSFSLNSTSTHIYLHLSIF